MRAADDDLEIDHPSDIAALLDEAVQSSAQLHLTGPNQEEMALVMLRWDQSLGILLRLPGLRAEAPQWLLKEAVHAHAVLDKVRIDFALGPVRQLLEADGLPVLKIEAPQRMRRHQRRQAFRVAPSSKHHPRALLALAGNSRPTRLATQDLSAGGVAIIWTEGDGSLPVQGQRLDGVELELERELRLLLSLQVEHVRQNDQGQWVVGCAFIGLTAQAERVLLLHLNQLQRRQRLLAR
jgi:c-di-GMP-binding flagellar brake protein YcgR